tara:strand:- start:1976 stop:2935 length:960 start_codon:yes stop_codon:yes gene_type:complete
MSAQEAQPEARPPQPQLSAAAVLAAREVLFNADLLPVILRTCDATTLARMGRVCEFFRNVGVSCWKAHCEKDWPARAKLPVQDWRFMYSMLANLRAAKLGRRELPSLLDPKDLIFAVEIVQVLGHHKVLANTFTTKLNEPANEMFTWDVSQEPELIKLQNYWLDEWVDLDGLVEDLQRKTWFISVTIFHKKQRKMLMLFDQAVIEPMLDDEDEFDPNQFDDGDDETQEPAALNFERVTLLARSPEDDEGRACVRAVLQPFYKRDQETNLPKITWEFGLKFAWQAPLEDPEDDVHDGEASLMTDRETLRMLASLPWEVAG